MTKISIFQSISSLQVKMITHYVRHVELSYGIDQDISLVCLVRSLVNMLIIPCVDGQYDFMVT